MFALRDSEGLALRFGALVTTLNNARSTYSLHGTCFFLVNQNVYYGILTIKLVNQTKETTMETLGIGSIVVPFGDYFIGFYI